MITITNNFIHNQYFLTIHQRMHARDFPWSLCDSKNIKLRHDLVLGQGKYISYYTPVLLSDILKAIKPEVVLEAYACFYGTGSKIIEFTEESAFLNDKKYKTLVLFFNSNDGYFKIVGGDTVPSVENRAILIDSPVPFILTNCTKPGNQVVLTIHYQ